MARLRCGRLQIRRAQPGKLTREAEQAFLAALSATCNVSLAAAAVGAAEGAFHRRKRKDRAFAREMHLALETGYDRLEAAAFAAGLATSHEHDEWRSNALPAIPPMTANQALQLLYLHQKGVKLAAEPPQARRRRGESDDSYDERLALMAEARLEREREKFEVAEAERWSRGEAPWGPAGEAVRCELGLVGKGSREKGGSCGANPAAASRHPPSMLERPLVDPHGHTGGGRPDLAVSRRNDACCAPLTLRSAASMLPDLAQVSGWSTADPAKVPHDSGRALFGGWRLDEMERKLGGDRPRE